MTPCWLLLLWAHAWLTTTQTSDVNALFEQAKAGDLNSVVQQLERDPRASTLPLRSVLQEYRGDYPGCLATLQRMEAEGLASDDSRHRAARCEWARGNFQAAHDGFLQLEEQLSADSPYRASVEASLPVLNDLLAERTDLRDSLAGLQRWFWTSVLIAGAGIAFISWIAMRP